MYLSYHYILIFIIYFTTTECKPFRLDYIFYQAIGGHLKYHNIPATWAAARLICAMEGGVLASPSNRNMKRALDTEMKGMDAECGIFIGVNSIISKGYFLSIEGMPLGDMPLKWLPGQPDNVDNNEDCISYVDGKVADVNCSEVLPFVCYKKDTEISKSICDSDDESEGCFKFHLEHRTWSEASQQCTAEGGHLVVIRSAEEAARLRQAYLNLSIQDMVNNNVFIGFQDWSGRGDWRTVQGQTLEDAGFSDWDKGHPDESVAGKSCGALQLHNAKLINHRCDHARPFLCAVDLNNFSAATETITELQTYPELNFNHEFPIIFL